jgi:hypothetical protein
MALAILLSGLAASMTDWFFFGVLFHDKCLVYPEIWRQGPGGGSGALSRLAGEAATGGGRGWLARGVARCHGECHDVVDVLVI